jgi:hypothetical protein
VRCSRLPVRSSCTLLYWSYSRLRVFVARRCRSRCGPACCAQGTCIPQPARQRRLSYRSRPFGADFVCRFVASCDEDVSSAPLRKPAALRGATARSRASVESRQCLALPATAPTQGERSFLEHLLAVQRLWREVERTQAACLPRRRAPCGALCASSTAYRCVCKPANRLALRVGACCWLAEPFQL